jgi:hypothetical protein
VIHKDWRCRYTPCTSYHNLTRTLPFNLLGGGVGVNVGLIVGCGIGLDAGRLVGAEWREDKACESHVYQDRSVRRYRIIDVHSEDKSLCQRRLTELNYDRWNGWKAESRQSRYYYWARYYYWGRYWGRYRDWVRYYNWAEL